MTMSQEVFKVFLNTKDATEKPQFQCVLFFLLDKVCEFLVPDSHQAIDDVCKLQLYVLKDLKLTDKQLQEIVILIMEIIDKYTDDFISFYKEFMDIKKKVSCENISYQYLSCYVKQLIGCLKM